MCPLYLVEGFPGGSVGKEFACNPGDSSVRGWGRSFEEGNGSPRQDSCLENPMDREAWWTTVHGVVKSQTQTQHHHHILSNQLLINIFCANFSYEK